MGEERQVRGCDTPRSGLIDDHRRPSHDADHGRSPNHRGGCPHDYGLYWWEQGEPKPDGTTTWTEHLIDDSWSQAHSLVWADLDGDRQGELITGKRVRGHAGRDPGGKDPECLFYYTWDASAREFTRHDISPFGGGVGAGMQICVADLNEDSRPDIAVSGKTGTWVLLSQGLK